MPFEDSDIEVVKDCFNNEIGNDGGDVIEKCFKDRQRLIYEMLEKKEFEHF